MMLPFAAAPPQALEYLFGRDLVKKLASSRLLVVGAGGIGCELLKNIATLGVPEVQVVDLDTIDITNLNRQFLFSRSDVGRSKAKVACQHLNSTNGASGTKFVPHHDDITASHFDVRWFAEFTLVFNALDNIKARRHVNQQCVAAGVPLIDAGTGGYSGQAFVHIAGVTDCYDCTTKPPPKTYPVCTIRSTPTEHIHCVVWVKNYLFPLLFQCDAEEYSQELQVDDSIESDDQRTQLNEETRDMRRIRELMKSSKEDTEFARALFNKIYNSDINKLLELKVLWKTRLPPKPLDWKISEQETRPPTALSETELPRYSSLIRDFSHSALRLAQRHSREGDFAFDKDDEDSMRFVAAASNLRAWCFGIRLSCNFDIVSVAGSIVPIVATTNAIVAGIATSHAIQVLRAAGEVPSVGTAFLVRLPTAFVISGVPPTPNPECSVCSRAYWWLRCSAKTTTLGHVVEKISSALKVTPTLFCGGNLLYDGDDFDDDEDEKCKPTEKLLSELGVTHNSLLHCQCEASTDADGKMLQPVSVIVLYDEEQNDLTCEFLSQQERKHFVISEEQIEFESSEDLSDSDSEVLAAECGKKRNASDDYNELPEDDYRASAVPNIVRFP